MASSKNLLQRLTGGDRRSIGRSDEVAALVLKQPALFAELMTGVRDADPLVRMRAADAAEKASRQQPELLRPFKAELLRLLEEASQQEVLWHMAQMLPRVPLTTKERLRAASALRRHMQDPSLIVRTCALQALAEIAAEDASLQPQVKASLRKAMKTGTAAMKARSRKLLRQFGVP
jgi:hypothetical protein